MSDISAVLAALAAIEASVAVSDAVDQVTIRRVYDPPPPTSQKLNDLPCFINTFTFAEDVRGPFGVGTLGYQVTAQLFVGEAAGDLARFGRVGRKLHTAFVAALRGNMTLSGSATAGHDLRGGDPTEAIAPWAGIDYLSYVHLVTVPLWESATFGLGVP